MMCKRKLLLFVLLSLLSSALRGQESDSSTAPILLNLQALDSYLSNIESNSIEQQRELESLRQAIADSMSISEAQAEMLAELRNSLARQSEIQERQGLLLRKSLAKSKVLTLSLAVGVPVAAAAGAWIMWAICK
jgi:hypothetical protein